MLAGPELEIGRHYAESRRARPQVGQGDAEAGAPQVTRSLDVEQVFASVKSVLITDLMSVYG